MNILNPALAARAFLYFAYPAQLSGDVWTAIAKGGEAIAGYSGATTLAVINPSPRASPPSRPSPRPATPSPAWPAASRPAVSAKPAPSPA